eukprot:15465647-Alexandrium_andersonii.AAC.1
MGQQSVSGPANLVALGDLGQRRVGQGDGPLPTRDEDRGAQEVAKGGARERAVVARQLELAAQVGGTLVGGRE